MQFPRAPPSPGPRVGAPPGRLPRSSRASPEGTPGGPSRPAGDGSREPMADPNANPADGAPDPAPCGTPRDSRRHGGPQAVSPYRIAMAMMYGSGKCATPRGSPASPFPRSPNDSFQLERREARGVGGAGSVSSTGTPGASGTPGPSAVPSQSASQSASPRPDPARPAARAPLRRQKARPSRAPEAAGPLPSLGLSSRSLGATPFQSPEGSRAESPGVSPSASPSVSPRESLCGFASLVPASLAPLKETAWEAQRVALQGSAAPGGPGMSASCPSLPRRPLRLAHSPSDPLGDLAEEGPQVQAARGFCDSSGVAGTSGAGGAPPAPGVPQESRGSQERLERQETTARRRLHAGTNIDASTDALRSPRDFSLLADGKLIDAFVDSPCATPPDLRNPTAPACVREAVRRAGPPPSCGEGDGVRFSGSAPEARWARDLLVPGNRHPGQAGVYLDSPRVPPRSFRAGGSRRPPGKAADERQMSRAKRPGRGRFPTFTARDGLHSACCAAHGGAPGGGSRLTISAMKSHSFSALGTRPGAWPEPERGEGQEPGKESNSGAHAVQALPVPRSKSAGHGQDVGVSSSAAGAAGPESAEGAEGTEGSSDQIGLPEVGNASECWQGDSPSGSPNESLDGSASESFGVAPGNLRSASPEHSQGSCYRSSPGVQQGQRTNAASPVPRPPRPGRASVSASLPVLAPTPFSASFPWGGTGGRASTDFRLSAGWPEPTDSADSVILKSVPYQFAPSLFTLADVDACTTIYSVSQASSHSSSILTSQALDTVVSALGSSEIDD